MQKENNYWNWLHWAAIAALLVWVIVMTVKWPEVPEQGQWQCNQLECVEFTTAEQWVNENCFVQEEQVVCAVMVDGVRQLFPIEQIDTTKLNQCLVARCIQEVNVRTSNYTVDFRNQTQS